jgi:hypothetical protein
MASRRGDRVWVSLRSASFKAFRAIASTAYASGVAASDAFHSSFFSLSVGS